MTLDSYLASPQAERDVAALLADPDAYHKAKWDADDLETLLELGTSGAWRVVSLEGGDEPRVYFRPEGDRFVVSDLGEAVRALRLRTGCRADEAAEALREEITAIADEPYGLCMCNRSGTIQAEWTDSEGVPAADLPRAIVAVLRAAGRVASLG